MLDSDLDDITAFWLDIACSKSWFHIRRSLEKLQVTECHGTNHIFFKLNEVISEVREVFESVKIPLPVSVLGISDLQKKATRIVDTRPIL